MRRLAFGFGTAALAQHGLRVRIHLRRNKRDLRFKSANFHFHPSSFTGSPSRRFLARAAGM